MEDPFDGMLTQKIEDNLTILKSEASSISNFARPPISQTDLMKRIYGVLSEIKTNIHAPKFSNIKIIKPIWSNCGFTQRLCLLRDKPDLKYQRISSKKGLMFLTNVLAKVLKLKSVKSTVTKREFYYQNREILNSMESLDAILEFISSLLDVPPWGLGILSTSKGVVAGSLTIKCNSKNYSSCSGGMLIPQDITLGATLTSSAKFVLVVEKFAAFQKIIDENFVHLHGPCIVLTAKGYPDLNTRVLLKLIWDQLSLPIFALVDADPYGIEIMTVYRFGSLGYVHLSDILSVPCMKWIGIHPSDIADLFPNSEPLSERDITKANQLLARPTIAGNEQIQNQVKCMIQLGLKSGIEGIGTISHSYLSDVYIPMKMASQKWI